MFVKVTGYLEIDEEDFDPGPMGPLTNEAYEVLNGVSPQPSPSISDLEDLEVETDDR